MKNDPPDFSLHTGVSSRSSEAVGPLLERHRGYLKLLARVWLRAEIVQADPSDLVQEAFVLAFKGFEHFRGQSEAELSSWLRTILARCIADFHRRKSVRATDLVTAEAIAAELDQSSTCWTARLVSPGESPQGIAERRESLIILAEALDRLPCDYREAIVLRQLEELPFAEVAVRMDRSIDSVRKLWTRGMIELRSAIKELG